VEQALGIVIVAVVAAAALVALSMIPFFLSETYSNRGIRTGTSDPGAAYADLGRAADWNPLTSFPLLGEAFIAREEGDRARALSALDEAEGRNPEDWQPYFMEAQLLKSVDRAKAQAALARARALNPLDEGVTALSKAIGPA
jgi:tetratricopeptide (TPR) repeat protein